MEEKAILKFSGEIFLGHRIVTIAWLKQKFCWIFFLDLRIFDQIIEYWL